MLKIIIGEVIREFRLSKSLSQEKLAELSELDRTYISLIERGKRNPTLQAIFQLAYSMETSPTIIIETIQKRYENCK
jgi:transcriptional regulator with XRE-family HTH domain